MKELPPKISNVSDSGEPFDRAALESLLDDLSAGGRSTNGLIIRPAHLTANEDAPATTLRRTTAPWVVAGTLAACVLGVMVGSHERPRLSSSPSPPTQRATAGNRAATTPSQPILASASLRSPGPKPADRRPKRGSDAIAPLKPAHVNSQTSAVSRPEHGVRPRPPADHGQSAVGPGINPDRDFNDGCYWDGQDQALVACTDPQLRRAAWHFRGAHRRAVRAGVPPHMIRQVEDQLSYARDQAAESSEELFEVYVAKTEELDELSSAVDEDVVINQSGGRYGWR